LQNLHNSKKKSIKKLAIALVLGSWVGWGGVGDVNLKGVEGLGEPKEAITSLQVTTSTI